MYEYNSFWNKRDKFDRDMEKLEEQNKIIMEKYNNLVKKQYENADVSFKKMYKNDFIY